LWLDSELTFEKVFAAGMCPFSSAVAHYLDQRSGQLCVLTAHCDQLRRSFDMLAAGAERRAFLLNLPVTWQSPAAETLLQRELVRLSKWLVANGGNVPTWEELWVICEGFHQARKRLTEAAARFPASAYAVALGEHFRDGGAEPTPHRETELNSIKPHAGLSGSPNKRCAAVALVGGPLPKSHFGLFRILDELGAKIVLNATETGECLLGSNRSSVRSLPPAETRTVDGLARAFAKYALSRWIAVWQRPNSRLYEWLQAAVVERKPQAILLWHYTACDLWRGEAATLREVFGLPVLQLECGGVEGASPRLTGRLAALIESLP
jgi:hypothetical protein